MRARSTRAATSVVIVLLIALLSGCAIHPAPRPVPTTPPLSPTTSAADVEAATDGLLSVGVTQGRSDYAVGRFAAAIENTTRADLTVRSVDLSSPVFVSDVLWEGEVSVPPGTTRDLRVAVPVFVCPVVDRSLSIAVGYRVGETERTARLVPLDPFRVIERLSDDACVAAATSEVVAIGLADALVVEGSGSAAVATLTLTLSPAADPSAGSVTITEVDATTLLSPTGGTSRWTIGVDVNAGESARTIALETVPARCDAHAVAEDKVGTILRVRVAFPDGAEGFVMVPASSTLRALLYAFIAESCGH